jgi:hypothetical protein
MLSLLEISDRPEIQQLLVDYSTAIHSGRSDGWQMSSRVETKCFDKFV